VYRNDVIVTDYASGKVYKLRPDRYDDNGDPLVREFTTTHSYDPAQLDQLVINRVRLDMEGGAGLQEPLNGSSPKVMLQVSRDGGHTWGREMWRMTGKGGDYQHRAEWTRLGQARDFIFKFRVTDPVKFVAIGGYLDAQVSVS
jgi:hypothetical protein